MKLNEYRIKTWQGALILLVAVGCAAFFVLQAGSEMPQFQETKISREIARISPSLSPQSDPVFSPPAPPSMERMKKQGCVADGLLSGFGNISGNVKVVNRSNCYYLHRALETWREPPDFKAARKIKNKIKKSDLVYGMFIAEAIDTKDNYYFPAEDREFEFDRMCRSGSENFWGEHTCKPSFGKSEYRKYLRYITEQAMDMGIQGFLFGQIFYQDDIGNPLAPDIIREMREYAEFSGIEIVIGAQTNDIAEENYLKLFDYIEGGVGIDGNGNIENSSCLSRWWQKAGDWCWALLWHEKFASQANDVMLHFDWSGKVGDDMSTFVNMDKNSRSRTLKNLHQYFLARDMGFLVPVLAILPKENGGCHGKDRRYYSPDNKYSCQDEDVINQILRP